MAMLFPTVLGLPGRHTIPTAGFFFDECPLQVTNLYDFVSPFQNWDVNSTFRRVLRQDSRCMKRKVGK